MGVFTLTTTIPTKSGFVWFPIEAEADTIDDLHEIIADDGLLKCTKLNVRFKSDVRYVESREPAIFGLNAIISITPLHVELIDERGGVLGG